MYKENLALKALKDNTNVIIRPSDKGDSEVVLDRGLFVKLVYDMLGDTNFCHKLTSDPTTQVRAALECLLAEGVTLGIIDNKRKEHLLVKDPICSLFHALPKTYKQVFPPPLRPIVAGIGSLVENLCIWLDDLLQLLVKRG